MFFAQRISKESSTYPAGKLPSTKNKRFRQMQTVENHRGDIYRIILIQSTRIEFMGMTTNSIAASSTQTPLTKQISITWLPGLSCFHWTGPRFFWISNPKTLINSSSLCHPGMCGWGFPKPKTTRLRCDWPISWWNSSRDFLRTNIHNIDESKTLVMTAYNATTPTFRIPKQTKNTET